MEWFPLYRVMGYNARRRMVEEYFKRERREGYLQHTLVQLIVGFHKFADNKGKNAQNHLSYAFQLFLHQCNKHGVLPPKNYLEFIKMMRKPVKNWGIKGVEQYFPEELPLIDDYLRPIPETDELVFSIDEEIDQFIPEEIENHFYQTAMRDFVTYCRQHQLEEAYRQVRLFLSNPEHAVLKAMDYLNFGRLLKKFGLESFIDRFYEEVSHISNFYKCPHCQWTLRYDEKEQRYVCNYNSPCHERANLQHAKPFEDDGYAYFRLTPGIQRFVLIPGMCEVRLQNRLEKHGYKTTMYPEIDRYDIKVEHHSGMYKLDVKDYRSSFFLAKQLANDYIDEGLVEDIIYVIPQEQVQRNPHYLKEVKRYLTKYKEASKSICVISERELIKYIGR